MKGKKMCTTLALVFLMMSCTQTGTGSQSAPDSIPPAAEKPSGVQPAASHLEKCQPGEELLYGDEVFSSYTEDKVRGDGVVSFQMEVNDRLAINNEDGSVFGEIVQNEDRSYFTLNMPKRIVARRVITHPDLASFDFDAENSNTEKDSLVIYVNKEKRKVKKTGLKFTYAKWADYLKDNKVMLKTCNLLPDASGKQLGTSKDQIFTITEVKDDRINVVSAKECHTDGVTYKAMQGWVKWRTDGALAIKFTACDE